MSHAAIRTAVLGDDDLGGPGIGIFDADGVLQAACIVPHGSILQFPRPGGRDPVPAAAGGRAGLADGEGAKLALIALLGCKILLPGLLPAGQSVGAGGMGVQIEIELVQDKAALIDALEGFLLPGGHRQFPLSKGRSSWGNRVPRQSARIGVSPGLDGHIGHGQGELPQLSVELRELDGGAGDGTGTARAGLGHPGPVDRSVQSKKLLSVWGLWFSLCSRGGA